jgi:hypothetical protein
MVAPDSSEAAERSVALAAVFAAVFAAQAVVGNVVAVVAEEERTKLSAADQTNRAAASPAAAADIGPVAERRPVRLGSIVSLKSEALLRSCSDRAYA